jgi:hypothetical protein
LLHWTALERRLRDALFAAILPGDPASGLPPLAELDLAPFWRELADAAPPLLRFGLRASTWALTLLPPFLLAVPRPFHALAPPEQERFLERAAASPIFLVRQMVLTLKTLAAMAYLRDPRVRALVDRGDPS